MFYTYQGLKKVGVVEMWGGGGGWWIVLAHGLYWNNVSYTGAATVIICEKVN